MNIRRLMVIGGMTLMLLVLTIGTALAEGEEPPEPEVEDPQANPVLVFLAGLMEMDTQAILDSGYGLGEIGRAYNLVYYTKELTAEEGAEIDVLLEEILAILALKTEDVGWGELFKDAGLHPGGKGLGSLIGKGKGLGKNKTAGSPDDLPEGKEKPEHANGPKPKDEDGKPLHANGPKPKDENGKPIHAKGPKD